MFHDCAGGVHLGHSIHRDTNRRKKMVRLSAGRVHFHDFTGGVRAATEQGWVLRVHDQACGVHEREYNWINLLFRQWSWFLSEEQPWTICLFESIDDTM